jgi:hypothetical protein
MSRELDTVRGRRGRNALTAAENSNREVAEVDAYPVSPLRPSNLSGMFTFRYSCTEIYAEDGNIHVKTKQTRYQDGRLTSEECEGTLDGRAYDRMVSEAQGYFLSQVGNFMKLLYAPFASRSRRYDE